MYVLIWASARPRLAADMTRPRSLAMHSNTRRMPLPCGATWCSCTTFSCCSSRSACTSRSTAAGTPSSCARQRQWRKAAEVGEHRCRLWRQAVAVGGRR